MTEVPLFPAAPVRPAPPPAPPEPQSKPAPVRCEEPGCGRPIWAEASIRAGPDGRRRGAECRRRYNAARRRARIVIADRPAWDVPGQLTITDQEEPVIASETFQGREIARVPERFVGLTVTMSGKDGGMWERVTIVAHTQGELHLEGGSWIRDTFAADPVREPLTEGTSRVYTWDIARGTIHHDVPGAAR